MGRIIQASLNYKELIPLERKALNITQWQYIECNPPNVELCVAGSVFHIENITIEEINRINHNNESDEYVFKYKMAKLSCTKCGGTGIIDWIDKATKSNSKPKALATMPRYIRNRKGVVTVLKGWNDVETYVSSPKIRLGEELCYECYGCGLKLSAEVHKIISDSFNHC